MNPKPRFERAGISATLAILLALLSIAHSRAADPSPRPPVRLIFDTDMAEDVDDVGALAVIHALADRGECELLAVMVCARNEAIGPCADAINTWYGRPDIPIGYQRNLRNGYPQPNPGDTSTKYADKVAAAFPHDLQRSSDAPDAARLYRRILASQPDTSVTIVSVGFLNNLRDLLDTPKDEFSDLDGEALVRRKVRQWVCMGGKFPQGRFDDGNGEYNVMYDTTASIRALHDWPTPVVLSGFEIGVRIFTGGALGDLPAPNPIQMAYRYYTGGKARESWDLTAALFAIRGPAEYWTLSEPGFCLMHNRVPHGYNDWIPTPGGNHRYLRERLPPAEIGRLLDDLLKTPPRRGH